VSINRLLSHSSMRAFIIICICWREYKVAVNEIPAICWKRFNLTMQASTIVFVVFVVFALKAFRHYHEEDITTHITSQSQELSKNDCIQETGFLVSNDMYIYISCLVRVKTDYLVNN